MANWRKWLRLPFHRQNDCYWNFKACVIAWSNSSFVRVVFIRTSWQFCVTRVQTSSSTSRKIFSHKWMIGARSITLQAVWSLVPYSSSLISFLIRDISMPRDEIKDPNWGRFSCLKWYFRVFFERRFVGVYSVFHLYLKKKKRAIAREYLIACGDVKSTFCLSSARFWSRVWSCQ